MILHNAIALFLREQTIRGNSESTVNYYKNTLILFKVFLGDKFNIYDLDLSHYNDYKLFLLSGTMNRVSVNTNLRSVKAFIRYLIDEYNIKDFTSKLSLIKANKGLKLPLSDDEINELILCFNDDYYGLRNICIVLLMLDCGLRKGEVIGLKYDSFDLKKGYVIVEGKGFKQRIVPFGGVTSYYLNRYIVECNGNIPGAFFSITHDAVKMLFQRLKKRTGIKRLSAHLLRHTFATRYILNGGNLESLRLFLGHSSIEITQVYLHLATQQKLLNAQHISIADILAKKKEG